jgi:hypothetical protein
MPLPPKIRRPQAGETPVVVAAHKRWQPDINIRVLQQSRQAGLAIDQQQRAIEDAAAGKSDNILEGLVSKILYNSDIEISLKVLKLGFVCRVINLTAGVPAEIISPSKWPRGYIVINPAEVSGFATTITPFPSLLRIPATYNSAAFNVSGVDTARFFLNVTVLVAGGTLTVAAQTQDPLTLNWATSQADIFGGAVAVGTYYASIGPLGVDRQLRLQAVVGVANVTFSVSGLLKGSTLTPTGSTVYIGGPDVTSFIGYPILPAQREYFWLGDDVSLYAISPTEPMTLKVFQLQ